MTILAQHDRAGGFRILAEGAEPRVAYVASKQQVKLSLAEEGRELLVYLDAAAAKDLINALMGEVHKHKVAVKRRQSPQPLLRRQANKPERIPVVR
jgi:hypothetical protein